MLQSTAFKRLILAKALITMGSQTQYFPDFRIKANITLSHTDLVVLGFNYGGGRSKFERYAGARFRLYGP